MTLDVRVESSSKEAFGLAMRLAFMGRSKATHFLVDKEVDALVLFWADPTEDWPNAVKLDVPMGVEQASEWAWTWLDTQFIGRQRPATYADGLSAAFLLKGGGEFRLHWRDGFMPGDGSSYGIAAVYPIWQEMHK